jgi:stage III sporulation protein AB
MNAVRLLGVVMVATSGCAAGISAGIERKKRFRALSELISAIDVLENEICYRCSPVCDALAVAAEASTVLRTASHFAGNNPLSLSAAFRDAAAQHRLSPEDSVVLAELGSAVGRYGAEEQKVFFEYAKARFQARLSPEEESAYRTAKLYRTLGICGGLAAAVILL